MTGPEKALADADRFWAAMGPTAQAAWQARREAAAERLADVARERRRRPLEAVVDLDDVT